LRVLIYPGTFDPFTNGHVDIARRAARLCDRLIVAILINSSKKSFFTTEERTRMAQIALQGLPNVEVESFGGLLDRLLPGKPGILFLLVCVND